MCPKILLFFSGLSSLGALGSNTVSRFGCPKIPLFFCVPKNTMFFCGLSNLGALGSNTASFLGAQKYSFSFGCPKIPLFFSGLSSLGAFGSNTASLLGALKYRFSFGCPKEPLFCQIVFARYEDCVQCKVTTLAQANGLYVFLRCITYDMEFCTPTSRELRFPMQAARGIVAANIDDDEFDEDLEKVSLFELCCGRTSKFANYNAKLGGASLRGIKPRQWRPKRRRRQAETRGGNQTNRNSDPPKLSCSLCVNWGIDIHNATHRMKILIAATNFRPAKGCTAAHLHSSFPCSDYCSVHCMKDPQGKWPRYQDALSRLTFERKVQFSFCKKSSDGSFRISRSYEKSGASYLRHLRGSGEDGAKWPWGITAKTPRVRVSSCMVGLFIGVPRTLSAHVWVVQSDYAPLRKVLQDLHCCGGHDHASTVRDGCEYAARNNIDTDKIVAKTKVTENYTPIFGALLALGISLRAA
jgi:hypothetical protein